MSATLSGLFLYPVKSLGGFSVPTATVDSLGLVGDRRFLVIDASGRFLTQRTHPRMALVATGLTPTHLTLSTAPSTTLTVPLASDPTAPLRSVSVWKSENLVAEDCGEPAAAFLSDALATPCRLVRIGPAFHRPILKSSARTGENLAFADGYPLLVISEASLDNLNDRIAAQGADPVPMDRFRPNLVVTGVPAFAEDQWPRFVIGDVTFRAGGPCARCILTTTDQATGQRAGPEPLRTLAAYRRDATDPTNVNFGQNLIHESHRGTLRVGDPLKILG